MDISSDSIKLESSTFVEVSSDDDDDIIGVTNKKIVVEISSDEENINSILDLEGLPLIKAEENQKSVNLTEKSKSLMQTRSKTVQKRLFPINDDKQPNPDTSTKHHGIRAKKKLNAIKNLFPSSNSYKKVENIAKDTSVRTVCTPMVAGVKVKLPVNPYASQIALMYNFIKSIKEHKNCILESPTGSGKTLALLCGVLAWQVHEKNVIAQEMERQQAELSENISHMMDMSSPNSSKTAAPVTPEKLFTKQSFGEKSIYQNPEVKFEAQSPYKRPGPYLEGSVEENDGDNSIHQNTEVKVETPSLNYKRPGPNMDSSVDNNAGSSHSGLVNIHKKPRHLERSDDTIVHIPNQVTPEKHKKVDSKETPESISVPTIYYGARTHTQLQQVIKEFKRTAYCGLAKMTILSSRDKTCIKEFDRKVWISKDDMCRNCIKPKNKYESSCQYFDNRRVLDHDNLPDAFDLEDLVNIGYERRSCPYYGARLLAKRADIIFCPYNYLIDPAIRSSMQIDLADSIIVIDEAHNIESICRDAASYSFTQKQIQAALKELQRVAEYRFQIKDIEHYLNDLIDMLKGWNDWFSNQIPILNSKTPNYNKKVVYSWDALCFVKTLQSHNIGYSRIESFKCNTEVFCRKLRDDPRTLIGVTQFTASLLESLTIVLGYLFRDEVKHIYDFKPALEADVNEIYKNKSLDNLTLHLHCLNSAIVMSSLHVARCIALASGTLTPMLSIHAELGTPFPMMISPVGKMPQDKVWIGVVKGDNKTSQEYTYGELQQPATRDRFGFLVERVCELTPHGVLCFVNSYASLDNLINRWKLTGLWCKLNEIKHVFLEQKTTGEHEDMMKEFYEKVGSKKGALLLAVYRGKVSEGMDFKDHQARAVICMGIPYPNITDIAVKAKIEYNEKYRERGLLGRKEWIQIQAYRALNQALGRCVRHQHDWGAVLLVDNRYSNAAYTEHLSKWVGKILNSEPYTYETLESRADGLATFMQRMKIEEEQDAAK